MSKVPKGNEENLIRIHVTDKRRYDWSIYVKDVYVEGCKIWSGRKKVKKEFIMDKVSIKNGQILKIVRGEKR